MATKPKMPPEKMPMPGKMPMPKGDPKKKPGC